MCQVDLVSADVTKPHIFNNNHPTSTRWHEVCPSTWGYAPISTTFQKVFVIDARNTTHVMITRAMIGMRQKQLGLSGRDSEKNLERPRIHALRAFPGIPLESTAGNPKALSSKAFEEREHFKNSPALRTAGDASLFCFGTLDVLNCGSQFAATSNRSIRIARPRTV